MKEAHRSVLGAGNENEPQSGSVHGVFNIDWRRVRGSSESCNPRPFRVRKRTSYGEEKGSTRLAQKLLEMTVIFVEVHCAVS